MCWNYSRKCNWLPCKLFRFIYRVPNSVRDLEFVFLPIIGLISVFLAPIILACLERCLSGRKERFAKSSYGLHCTVGSNPTLSAKALFKNRAFCILCPSMFIQYKVSQILLQGQRSKEILLVNSKSNFPRHIYKLKNGNKIGV